MPNGHTTTAKKHIEVDRIGARWLLSIMQINRFHLVASKLRCKWPIMFQFQFLLLRSRNICRRRRCSVSAFAVFSVGCCVTVWPLLHFFLSSLSRIYYLWVEMKPASKQTNTLILQNTLYAA